MTVLYVCAVDLCYWKGFFCQFTAFPCGTVPQYLDASVSRYLSISVSQYLGISVPQYLGASVPQCLSTPVSRYLGISVPQHPMPLCTTAISHIKGFMYFFG